MSSLDVSSEFKAALDAAAAGRDPMDAAFGGGISSSLMPTPGASSSVEAAESSEPQSQEGNGGSEPGEEGKTEGSTASPTTGVDPENPEGKPNPDTETVTWGGKEVKIDYTDRNQIKRDKALAMGARTWQAERDSALAKVKAFEAQEADNKDARDFRSALTDAFEKKGLKGLVNLLTQDETGYDKYIAAEVERRTAYAKATPEQRAILDEKEHLAQLKQELEYDRKNREKQIEMASKKEKDAIAATEASNEKAFLDIASTSKGKNSFAGTLDNEDLEAALDTRVWEKVKTELSSMPDDTELTQAMMDKLFNKYYTAISKGLSGKIEKQADSKLQEKKRDAQTKLSTTAKNNNMPRGAVEEFNKAADGGNWGDMFKMILGGKVKL
jgi:hypothetical protein